MEKSKVTLDIMYGKEEWDLSVDTDASQTPVDDYDRQLFRTLTPPTSTSEK
jgi:hypothetical protein